MGLKDFYVGAEREDQSKASKLRTILHPSIIPDNSRIYNNCICWESFAIKEIICFDNSWKLHKTSEILYKA